MGVMKNVMSCYGYPVCPVCGQLLTLDRPLVRAGEYVIHLDCRERKSSGSK